MAETLYKEESYKIIGACFEVYKQKWPALRNLFTKNAWRSNLSFSKFLFSSNLIYRWITRDIS